MDRRRGKLCKLAKASVSWWKLNSSTSCIYFHYLNPREDDRSEMEWTKTFLSNGNGGGGSFVLLFRSWPAMRVQLVPPVGMMANLTLFKFTYKYTRKAYPVYLLFCLKKKKSTTLLHCVVVQRKKANDFPLAGHRIGTLCIRSPTCSAVNCSWEVHHPSAGLPSV